MTLGYLDEKAEGLALSQYYYFPSTIIQDVLNLARITKQNPHVHIDTHIDRWTPEVDGNPGIFLSDNRFVSGDQLNSYNISFEKETLNVGDIIIKIIMPFDTHYGVLKLTVRDDGVSVIGDVIDGVSVSDES